jgi:hypothetical protein
MPKTYMCKYDLKTASVSDFVSSLLFNKVN